MDRIEIEEMFAGLGEISIRRMFGGKGVYHQGLIVGVEFEGEMLLKADATSGPAFAQAGARQWGYENTGGKTILMPYWTIPDDAYDDPDQMAHWVRLAFEAALRAPAKGVKKAGKARKPKA